MRSCVVGGRNPGLNAAANIVVPVQSQPARLAGLHQVFQHPVHDILMEDPDIPLDEFCQLKIHPKKGNKQTLTLDKTEIRKALQMRPQIFD